MSEDLPKGKERGATAARRRWGLYIQALAVLLILGAGIGLVLLESTWSDTPQRRVGALVAEIERQESDDWLSQLLRKFFPKYGKGREPDKVAEDMGALGVEAVPEIITAASHRLTSVRRAAATALGEIGDRRAVAPLADLLAHDAESEVRRAAALALGQLGGPEATARLIEAMANSDRDVRWFVANALGEFGGPEATARLIEAMADSDSNVRYRVALALGEIGDPQATPALLAALRDADPVMRAEAAYSLGRLRDPRAVGALVSALGDKDESVRTYSAFALALQKRPEAVPVLAVTVTGESDWFAVEAVVSLALIDTPEARQALTVGARKAVRPSVRRLAERAQAMPIIEALAEELREKDRILHLEIVDAFVCLRDPASLPALEEALKSPHSDVRHKARRAIRLIRRSSQPQSPIAPPQN
jgi:HEAT repeat protein